MVSAHSVRTRAVLRRLVIARNGVGAFNAVPLRLMMPFAGTAVKSGSGQSGRSGRGHSALSTLRFPTPNSDVIGWWILDEYNRD